LEPAADILAKIDLLLEEKHQKDPYIRFTILGYQLGDVGKCMRYINIYPDDRRQYSAYLKTALSDLIIQSIIIARLYNFDIGELLRLGAERLEEFRKKGRYEEK
jgi:hypothetical protein